ncbi:hypothetical protein B005_1601 [Nocardiopsis alba ATCC BAA-2165]|uniref:Uncharacterized protein n=1 Tax=Nocardiopsis alba (strain ATCC BAA-2165 / BE74) TaxID=1205910 RepID=J7L294_NOCAA|nr:hypothetical protein B005_1601 [Nocardiopsis alba ATCC BAA-2165]
MLGHVSTFPLPAPDTAPCRAPGARRRDLWGTQVLWGHRTLYESDIIDSHPVSEQMHRKHARFP